MENEIRSDEMQEEEYENPIYDRDIEEDIEMEKVEKKNLIAAIKEDTEKLYKFANKLEQIDRIEFSLKLQRICINIRKLVKVK